MKHLSLFRRPYGAKKILEVGGGHAPYAGVTHAVDKFSDDNSQRAGNFILPKNVEFRPGDLENIPFSENFDFIYTSHVLEHVIQPEKAVAEINRVAKRGYLETPAPLREQIACPLPYDPQSDFHYLFCWTTHVPNTVCYIAKNENTIGDFCNCKNGQFARSLFMLRRNKNEDVEPLLPRAAKTTALFFTKPLAIKKFTDFRTACAQGACGYQSARIAQFRLRSPVAWFSKRLRRLNQLLADLG